MSYGSAEPRGGAMETSRANATHAVITDPDEASQFATEISDLLVSTYGSIDAIESHMLNVGHGLDVSIAESRVIDIVGRATLHGGEMSVSQLANSLGVRVPSATGTVRRLVSKGLVAKGRNPRDARRVDLTLTRAGERVFRLHAIFHKNMADAIAGDMTSDERELLLRGIRRLERFYAQVREA